MRTALTFSFARRVLWALLPLLLVFGACNNDDDDSDIQKEQEARIEAQKPIDDAAIQEYLKTNNIKPGSNLGEYTRTSTGLYIIFRKRTTDVQPKNGQRILVKYTGRRLANQSRFESTVDNGTACGCTDFFNAREGSYTLVGQFIEGWNEALTQYMHKGDDVQLLIPSHLAYGATGSGPIAPFTPLIFDLELLNVQQ